VHSRSGSAMQSRNAERSERVADGGMRSVLDEEGANII